MSDEELKEFIEQFDKFVLSFEAETNAERKNHKLSNMLRKNVIKFLAQNNTNIMTQDVHYAQEILEGCNYKSDILLCAYAQLHSKNRLMLTKQEINQLFKALVIKAYKENKSGFDLFRILITTNYVIKSENNFLFQLKCYFYDLCTKLHLCRLNIIN